MYAIESGEKSMSICLCSLSADAALELIAQNKIEVSPASPDPSSFTVDPKLVAEGLGDLVNKLPQPIELLVGSAKQRRFVRGIACHIWNGALPKSNVLALDEGIYIASPELTLLQQASQLHQASLCMMLGRYLGTWTPAEGRLNGQNERAPLTSFDALNKFLTSMGRVRGKDNLKLAMAYTCDRAASAPETSLQLALSLPPELYGLNITQPTMNYEVNLSSESQRLYPKDSIRIDLCWYNNQFGLEYQGKEHGNQLGDDYARWFAARKEGYELWFVAKEQLENASQLMRIGREVALRIGCDVDEALWPTESELQELLDILAGRTHPNPLTAAELRVRRSRAKARRRSFR